MSAPVTPLGLKDGQYLISDAAGQPRAFGPRQIRRADLLSLFFGDDKWLRATFPLERPVKIRGPGGKLIWTRRTVDFDLSKALDWISRECVKRGRVAHAEGA